MTAVSAGSQIMLSAFSVRECRQDANKTGMSPGRSLDSDLHRIPYPEKDRADAPDSNLLHFAIAAPKADRAGRPLLSVAAVSASSYTANAMAMKRESSSARETPISAILPAFPGRERMLRDVFGMVPDGRRPEQRRCVPGPETFA